MICRYINSRLPPIVISDCHAWLVVAYKRSPSSGNPIIQLWRHDDARGPYIYVDDPWDEPEEAHQPWRSAYLPLLPKAFLDAERAEVVGRKWIDLYRLSTAYTDSALERADDRPDRQDQATLRTFLVESNAYKQGLRDRRVQHSLADALRRTPMSRQIWVIEVVDRRARAANQPDVIGEIILDATLTQFEPDDDPNAIISLHVDDFAFISGVDGAPNTTISLDASSLYTSACPLLRRDS